MASKSDPNPGLKVVPKTGPSHRINVVPKPGLSPGLKAVPKPDPSLVLNVVLKPGPRLGLKVVPKPENINFFITKIVCFKFLVKHFENSKVCFGNVLKKN